MSKPESKRSEAAANNSNWQPTVWLTVALILLLAALAYWPGLGGGFVFDDIQNIVVNPTLMPEHWGLAEWIAAAFSSPSSSLQRPFAMSSFALNTYFSGLDPWPMKLTNLGIHLLNTVLVFVLTRQLISTATKSALEGPARNVALVVATLWALSPINLMAVLYVVQRMESLCHVFVFAGLWLYLLGRSKQLRGEAGWALILAGILGGTLLGLTSKESSALLPLYALATEVCVFHFKDNRGRVDRRLLTCFTIGLVVPGIYFLYKFLPEAIAGSTYSGRSFTVGQRLLTEPLVVMEYLRWILLPNIGELSLYHDDFQASTGILNPPATLIGLLGIPALLVGSLLLRKRRPLTSLGLLWFLSAHTLTATILPLELIFEHRNYFASLGICLAIADLLLIAPRRKSMQFAGAVVITFLLIFYAGSTHLRAREWSNPLRFALTEAAKHPQSPRATYDVARSFIALTNYRADSPFVQPALQALRQARDAPGSGILPSQAALIFTARAGLQVDPGWWELMQSRLRARPIGAEEQIALVSLTNCAVEELCSFSHEQMLRTFEAALSQGSNAGVLSSYGKYAAHVLRDGNLALRLWMEARSQEPNNPQFRANLAMLQIQLGMTTEATAEIEALRRLGRFGQHEKSADDLLVYSRTVTRQRAAAQAAEELPR